MKKFINIFTLAVSVGFTIFVVDFSDVTNTYQSTFTSYSSEDQDSQFWDKFRESVTKEEPPKEAPPPKEETPREIKE